MLKKFSLFYSPAVWEFRDPDTRHSFQALTLSILSNHVRTYREQNDLPPLEYLDAVIENYNCNRPANLGRCVPLPSLKRGLFPMIKGGIVILKNLMYSSFVSQDKADERAQICLNCSQNQFPDRTTFIKWSDDLAIASIGDRRSTYHDRLGNCAVCTCPLRCKVWTAEPIKLEPDEILEMRQANSRCWQVKEVTNP